MPYLHRLKGSQLAPIVILLWGIFLPLTEARPQEVQLPLLINFRQDKSAPPPSSISNQFVYPFSIDPNGKISGFPAPENFPITVKIKSGSFLICRIVRFPLPTLSERGPNVRQGGCETTQVINNLNNFQTLYLVPGEKLSAAITAVAMVNEQLLSPAEYEKKSSLLIGNDPGKQLIQVLFGQLDKVSFEDSLSITTKTGTFSAPMAIRAEITKIDSNSATTTVEYQIPHGEERISKIECPPADKDPISKEYCRRQEHIFLQPQISRYLREGWASEATIDSALANTVSKNGLSVAMQLTAEICARNQITEQSGFSAGKDELAPLKARAIEGLFNAAKQDHKDSLGRTLRFYAAYYGCEVDLNKLGQSEKDTLGTPLYIYALAGKNPVSIKAAWNEQAKEFLKNPEKKASQFLLQFRAPSKSPPNLADSSILKLLYQSNSPEAMSHFSSLKESTKKNARYFGEAADLLSEFGISALEFTKGSSAPLWMIEQNIPVHILSRTDLGFGNGDEKNPAEQLEAAFSSGPEGILNVCNSTRSPDECFLSNRYCSSIKGKKEKISCLESTGRSGQVVYEGSDWKYIRPNSSRKANFCDPVKSKKLEYSACLLEHVQPLSAQEIKIHLKNLLATQEGATLLVNSVQNRRLQLPMPEKMEAANTCINSPLSFKAIENNEENYNAFIFAGEHCLDLIGRASEQEAAAEMSKCSTNPNRSGCHALPLLLQQSSDRTLLENLCNKGNPLACLRLFNLIHLQSLSPEIRENTALKICELSDYSIFCDQVRAFHNSGTAKNDALIKVTKNGNGNTTYALYERMKNKSVALKDIEPYADAFEKSCKTIPVQCLIAGAIYEGKKDAAALDRVMELALAHCVDRSDCSALSSLLANSPKFQKRALALCEDGLANLCQIVKSTNASQPIAPFPYEKGKARCELANPGTKDYCYSQIISLVENRETEFRDLCLMSASSRKCNPVYPRIANDNSTKAKIPEYEASCANQTQPGACVVLGFYFLKKDKTASGEYFKKSCENSRYHEINCKRALATLAENRMAKEIQAIFDFSCHNFMHAGHCLDRKYYQAKATRSPSDIQALVNECTPQNRRACINLATFYSEIGQEKKSKSLFKELCGSSSNKAGCLGGPEIYFNGMSIQFEPPKKIEKPKGNR